LLYRKLRVRRIRLAVRSRTSEMEKKTVKEVSYYSLTEIVFAYVDHVVTVISFHDSQEERSFAEYIHWQGKGTGNRPGNDARCREILVYSIGVYSLGQARRAYLRRNIRHGCIIKARWMGRLTSAVIGIVTLAAALPTHIYIYI